MLLFHILYLSYMAMKAQVFLATKQILLFAAG